MVVIFTLIVITLVINAAIYLSALWFAWIGIKAFPRKSYFLILPIALIVANVYFGFFKTLEIEQEYSRIKSGLVYKVRPKPINLTFLSYNSVSRNICNELCMELLFEEQIKYVSSKWDNLQKGLNNKTREITFESWRGNCFDGRSDLNSLNLYHAFYGYCIRPINIPNEAGFTVVLDQNLGYFYDSVLGGRKQNYRQGIAIIEGAEFQEELIAISAEYDPKVNSLPLMVQFFNSSGLNLKFNRSFKTHRFETSNSQKIRLKTSSNEKAGGKEGAAIDKHEILNAALGFELDGKIDFPSYKKPSVIEARKMIEVVFKSNDRGNVEIASKFAQSYQGFPFLVLMKGLAKTEKGRAAYLAQSYVDDWLKVNDTATYKQSLLDRKQKREDDKKQREFKIAKRVCESESKRDGRDCSQY